MRAALNEDGAGRVLVVDAGANMRCAIIGDLLSELAEKRGWVSGMPGRGAATAPSSRVASQLMPAHTAPPGPSPEPTLVRAAALTQAGMIINGCVRDTDEIKQFAVGIKALAPHPLKPGKRDGGLRDVPVVVGGTIVCPGDWIYADSGEHSWQAGGQGHACTLLVKPACYFLCLLAV